MIAQIVFSFILSAVLFVAFAQLGRIPLVGGIVICAALFGGYLVWMPGHATYLANAVGIGRGADLIFYVWVLISSAILLLLHLNAQEQLRLITMLARALALSDAERRETEERASSGKHE